MSEDHSQLLKQHLLEGESQSVEFKEMIPENTRELAYNIASFATSNPGSIYIGIENSGDIIGVELPDAKSKDDLQQRILGIANSVKPQIRVSVDFITYNNKIVVKISAPKGFKPVYSVGGIPYLRDLSSSRKAEPSEVEELYYKAFQMEVPKQEVSENQKFLAMVLNYIAGIKLALVDIDERKVNPYLDQLKYDLGVRGHSIFDLSAHPIAQELKINDDLKNLGKLLIEMESFKFWLGADSWNKFTELGRQASKLVENLIPKMDQKAIRDVKNIPGFIKSLLYLTNEFENKWELAKKYILGSEFNLWLSELTNFAYRFIERAYYLDPSKYPKPRQNLIKLATNIRNLATPKIFGYGQNGYNPISVMHNDVDQCIISARTIIETIKS